MTTIICSREAMFADKRSTGGHIMRVTKLFRVNGSVIGIAGNIEQALRFVEWRRTPEVKPTFADNSNFAALELTPDGWMIWWGSEMVGIPVEEEYFAIGSGAGIALGAMAMGATPKEAIKVASWRDEATGSEVQSMSLKGKQ
jgi:20S proteasome alpha/beta subunit